MGSEITPLLSIPELEEETETSHHEQYDSFDDEASFTRVPHKQQPSASERGSLFGRSSIFASIRSMLQNFTVSNDDRHAAEHTHHRRSPNGSFFEFGSMIINELSHEFIDYDQSESVALDALFSIAITEPSVDGSGGHIRHPTLDPKELVAATVLIVEEELDYGDLRWSLLSNTFFIFGGFYECISAVWNLDTNGSDSANTIWAVIRIGVALLGPLVYCLNSIVDITWAVRVEQRNERRHQLEELEIDLIAPDKGMEVIEKEGPSGEKTVRLRLPFEPHNILRRLRRHIGHRRALSAAVTFGLGAVFEFSSAYLGQFSTIGEEVIHIVDALSVNAYVASAIFALAKRGDERELKPWTELWHDASRLESLGDIFFGVATACDFAICYFHLDKLGSLVFVWPLISASLWSFDALCYLRADVKSMTLYKAHRPLGNSVTSNDTTCSSSTSSTGELDNC